MEESFVPFSSHLDKYLLFFVYDIEFALLVCEEKRFLSPQSEDSKRAKAVVKEVHNLVL